MHLQSKFAINIYIFLNELTKINYVKNYCEEVIFNIVITRVDLEAHNFDITIAKLISNLNNIFEEFNCNDPAEGYMEHRGNWP